MTVAERLVLKRQRHLKWRALDPLETVLMMLCGLLLFGFCTTVILDIVTREIGRPWLWLQEVTSTFFIYAIFIGAAVATRRNDHLYLTAISDALHGTPRLIVDRMNVELAKAARSPDVAQKFADQIDMEIIASTPEEFAAFQAREQERWFKVIKDYNIKSD